MAYTAIVLDEKSRSLLLRTFGHLWDIDQGWETITHHMTLHMGTARPEEKEKLGQKIDMQVQGIARSPKVIAVKVYTGSMQSDNETPHVTLAANRINGGKPVMSNYLKNWIDITPFSISGIVEEVKS